VKRNKWLKSTRSGDNGACTEVKHENDLIYVRDSKDPTGPVLAFTPGEWRAFVAGVRDGTFDL
jgi:hypothetical protein